MNLFTTKQSIVTKSQKNVTNTKCRTYNKRSRKDKNVSEQAHTRNNIIEKESPKQKTKRKHHQSNNFLVKKTKEQVKKKN